MCARAAANSAGGCLCTRSSTAGHLEERVGTGRHKPATRGATPEDPRGQRGSCGLDGQWRSPFAAEGARNATATLRVRFRIEIAGRRVGRSNLQRRASCAPTPNPRWTRAHTRGEVERPSHLGEAARAAGAAAIRRDEPAGGGRRKAGAVRCTEACSQNAAAPCRRRRGLPALLPARASSQAPILGTFAGSAAFTGKVQLEAAFYPRANPRRKEGARLILAPRHTFAPRHPPLAN